MNKQQQELYEKLLKKVNEYCLGYAAEDVIAAIDALVDSYDARSALEYLQDRYTFKKQSTPLEVWSLVKKYMNAYHHQIVNADVESVEGHPISIIEDSLKALEILKKYIKLNETGDDLFPYEIKECQYTSSRSQNIITQKEYELLKEVLK